MSESFSTKAIPGQLNVDEAEGIVECFVAGIGNKDSVGDIVVPGAFEGSLKRRRPRVVWGHDWNHPIGKVLDIYEVGPTDPRLPSKMRSAGIGGLFARVQFNLKSERGREAFANVVFFGGDQEWSIGYKTLKADYDNARQANLLREVELYEVSPVLHGANQLTATISIKADNAEDRVTSFKKSKWPMFDRQFAAMIKDQHPKIWNAGGNIKGDDQYEILTRIAAQGGVANTEDQIKALELREAWIARHEGDFRLPGVIAQIKWLAIGSRGEGHMKDVVREAISKDGIRKKADGECPPATQEIAVNLKNRQNAIDTAGYGPLNPAEPNAAFWEKKASRWDVSADEAKKQRCGNCAAFIKTESMLDCIKQGLGNEPGNDAIDVINAGDLGYCEAFDFKCASARTCDAWIAGGPVTKSYDYEDDSEEEYGSSEDDPMEELGRIAMRMRMRSDDDQDRTIPDGISNEAMGRRAVLARALANEMRTPVRIRTITGNTVVFDVMGEDEEELTMRASWHAERGRVMIGRPERVRVETVYVPMEGDSEGDVYMGDEEFKAPLPPDVVPQERITGDVLRGYGPRRGNLERLLRYWRPIMRREGGFRRCLVILANHPELYPLQNICAWLHHETTGLWPNEGCHHPGMKNCRRKLRGVVRGSLWSDSEFNNRIDRLTPNRGKGMPDPFDEEDQMEKEYGEVTDDDVMFANKVLDWFVGQEKEFMDYIGDDENWIHEGEDEDGQWSPHNWVRPENAPEGVSGKPGGCGCGCGGMGGKGSCGDMPKSIEDSLTALQEKVGRTLNSRNAEKISQAINLLTEVIGGSTPAAIERKGDQTFISADIEDLFELRQSIDPVLEHYGLEAVVDEDGIFIKDLEDDDAYVALKSIVGNFDEIQIKGIGRSIGRGKPGGLHAGRWKPHDGDGDGFFSPAPGAPDKTPIANLPEMFKPKLDPKKWGRFKKEDLDGMTDAELEDIVEKMPHPQRGGDRFLSADDEHGHMIGIHATSILKKRKEKARLDANKEKRRWRGSDTLDRVEATKKRRGALRDAAGDDGNTLSTTGQSIQKLTAKRKVTVEDMAGSDLSDDDFAGMSLQELGTLRNVRRGKRPTDNNAKKLNEVYGRALTAEAERVRKELEDLSDSELDLKLRLAYSAQDRAEANGGVDTASNATVRAILDMQRDRNAKTRPKKRSRTYRDPLDGPYDGPYGDDGYDAVRDDWRTGRSNVPPTIREADRALRDQEDEDRYNRGLASTSQRIPGAGQISDMSDDEIVDELSQISMRGTSDRETKLREEARKRRISPTTVRRRARERASERAASSGSQGSASSRTPRPKRDLTPPRGGFGSTEAAKKYADQIRTRIDNFTRADRSNISADRAEVARDAINSLVEAIMNPDENDEVVNYLLERMRQMPKVNTEDESIDPKDIARNLEANIRSRDD